MALTRLGILDGMWLGQNILRQLSFSPGFAAGIDIDATGEKAAIVGNFWHPDGPGTYSIVRAGFRFGSTITKAGGSALTASLQDVSLTAGPPIQPDETQDQTVAIANADATFAANTWHRTGAFSAARSVGFDDLLALVVEYDGGGRLGADTFRIGGITNGGRQTQAASVNKVGAPAWAIPANYIPNVVFEVDDGSFGTFLGAFLASAITSTNFGETSTPDEYAVKFQVPVELTVDAAMFAYGLVSQDAQFNLYSSDGSTVLMTVNRDMNAVQSTSAYATEFVFSSEITLAANTNYYAAVKVSSGATTTGGNRVVITVDDADQIPLHGWPLGACLSTRSDAGAWSDTTTQIPLAQIRIASIHDGTGSGSTIRPHTGGKFQRLT